MVDLSPEAAGEILNLFGRAVDAGIHEGYAGHVSGTGWVRRITVGGVALEGYSHSRGLRTNVWTLIVREEGEDGLRLHAPDAVAFSLFENAIKSEKSDQIIAKLREALESEVGDG